MVNKYAKIDDYLDYLATTLFHSRYAKIDSNYHRLPYPMIILTHAKAGSSKKAPCPVAHPQYLSAPPHPPPPPPAAQYTVGYGDRLKRTTT